MTNRSIKILDKAPTESHRDYLDLDTDEEEFGRQETPESLDDSPPEPEKPVYTTEELDTLIDHVKKLTNLIDLTEDHWTNDCLITIRRYFCEPSNNLLTIYYDDDKLRALLGFPCNYKIGLVYFLREPWQIYRADNFLNTIKFGSFNENPVRGILKLVGIFAPLVFKLDNNWPENRRDEILTNVNDLLTLATDLTYNPLKISILYVPWEEKNCETPKSRELLINRLEKIARNWIKRIHEALFLNITVSINDLYDVYDEFEFWQNRYKNMICLTKQLESDRVKTIVDQLNKCNSSSVKNIKSMIFKIKDASKQAESNLNFLRVLIDKCYDLNDPSNFHCLIELLCIVRFLWTESVYYNEPKNIERLASSLSVQIIKTCIVNIDLQLIFVDPKKCKKSVKTVLNCCSSYSKIYDEIIVSGCTMKTKYNWKSNKDVVFDRVEAFKQRCNDIIEICDAVIIYGSLNKINLGGTRDDKNEILYDYVKDYFTKITNEIRIACDSYALDVKNIKWFDDMYKFRRNVAQLENMIKKLLNGLFENVNDIETSIEILYTLFKFKDRRCFRDILKKKWTKVWKLYQEHVKISSSSSIADYKIIQDQLKLIDTDITTESIIINKNFLERLHKIIIDASDCFGY